MSATQKQEKTLEQKTLGRRELLKVLAATGGAVTAAAIVPGTWAKPVIEAGVMPAHAATSLLLGTLQVVMDWAYSGTPVDYELHVVDPCDGQDVFGGSSTTLTHSGDAPDDTTGTETVNDLAGLVAPGTYQVYVRSANFQTEADTLTVTVNVNGTPTNLPDMASQFTASNQSRRAADIIFPAGTVVNRVGDPYP